MFRIEVPFAMALEKFGLRLLQWALVGSATLLVSCSGESSPGKSEDSPTATDAASQLEYKVGDIGPGGGIIVYVDEDGFDNSAGGDVTIGTLCSIEICHYLEMAPTDIDGWHTFESAVLSSDQYSTTTASDWHLPTKDALNEMCKFAYGNASYEICNDGGQANLQLNEEILSPFNYWSSTEFDDSGAWTQNLGFGNQDYVYKDEEFKVRPVRTF